MADASGADSDGPDRIAATQGEFSLPAPVFECELDEIRARREVRGIDVSELDQGPPGTPSPSRGIVGMSLSGGGIRSSTFGFGVIQALAHAGVFQCVDYLSTVSGGGFTGSMLSSVLNDPAQADCAFPLRKDTGEGETKALQHLRDGSRYLASGSIAETLRVPLIVLRGLILSMLIVLPVVMLAVFLTELAYESGYWPNYDVLTGETHYTVLPAMLALFAVLVCLHPLVRSLSGPGISWQNRNRLELAMSVTFGIVLLAVLVEPVVDLISAAIETTAADWNPGQTLAKHLDPEQTPVLRSIGTIVAVIATVIVVVVLIRKLPESVLVGLIGLLGPGSVFALYLFLCLLQVDSPFLPTSLRADLDTVETATRSGTLDNYVLGPAECPEADDEQADDESDLPEACKVRAAHRRLVEAVRAKDPDLELGRSGLMYVMRVGRPATVGDLDAPASCDPLGPPQWLVVGPSLTDVWPEAVPGPAADMPLPACTPIVDEDVGAPEDINLFLGLDDAGEGACRWPQSSEPGLLALSAEVLDGCHDSFRIGEAAAVSTHESLLEVRGGRLGLWGEPHDQTWLDDLTFVAIAIGAFIYVLLFYNVNIASLHGFYRDRLSKLYLFRINPETGETESADDLALSQLNREGSPAPYHLINVTLNVTGGDPGSQRGRNAAFFVLSKHYCGGPRTGYAKTTEIEAIDPHVNLGTAMAISGAAAAPNMGTMTFGSLSFMMTLLNLRLGYWFPNPARISPDDRRWKYRAGPGYLTAEALGSLTIHRPLVNVSDGGHLENLGVYELLRRRCKLILAIDGERDAMMAFGGLITLMRFAEIDMGIDIDIDLDPLVLDDHRYSKAHWVVGTIHYGHGETGTLIYVKSSFSPERSPVLARYRSDNPDYPHESTADQSFSEEQFEAYRLLGFEIGEALLASEDAALLPRQGEVNC